MKIRPARVNDAEGIAHMHVESWRSSYKGIIAKDYLAGLSKKRRADRWRENLSVQNLKSCIFIVADENEQIIGVASGGPQRDTQLNYDGELYAIYLLKRFQRNGLGSRLMVAVATHLAANGFKNLLVWVLEKNPSRLFYEALGGKHVSKKTITIGEQDLIEVAYGWNSLQDFLDANAQ